MNEEQLKNFFDYLKKSWLVFGPNPAPQPSVGHGAGSGQLFGGKIFIGEIQNFDDLYLGPQLPFFSFKRFFVPEKETLFEYEGVELKSPSAPLLQRGEQVAIFGINLLDLKSILLYDQVFEKDPVYQARRQNILIVGHSLVPDVSQNIFEQTFEEDILEHLSFDVFLGAVNRQPLTVNHEYAVFTGSQKGQRVLEDFGYKDYIHIQFSGPVKEGKLDERMQKIQDKLKNHHNQKIWDELGKRCIECGKCTVACPTCFCFRIDDRAELGLSRAKRGDQVDNFGARERCWDSCYYQEFSEVAGPPGTPSAEPWRTGGHKFLNSTAGRIHFWYYHKFGRIPEEFNFMGCVGCRRCSAVCPVGIDIGEVLQTIEES